ncbi:MAG: leucine-rich repeat protein, partial [Ruminococcus sp.]
MKNIKIKSLLAILLTAVMLISMICIMPVSAADDEETTTITSGDFQYTVLTDGTAEIAKYTGSATDLTIPTDLDGKKVTRIGNYSFENNTTIKSLTIPTGIEIGNGAFRYCKIETLKLSDGVETIGSGAFSFCESLKALTLPDSVTTIDTFAFQDCKSLTSIKLSNKLEKISDFAFTGCEALTGINFPSSIKEIGQNAFAHCYGLTSVVIPGNVKIINTAAFSYCRNLSSVTLNEGIETISAYAFSTCTKLMEVTVPDSATEVVHMSLGYWWDDVTWNYLLVDGFVLKGYRGSAAESYAQEYGVTFVSIGDSILTPPTTAGPTEPTTAPAPGTVNTVYFKNTANFATPYAYYWSSATDSGPESWPGVAMEKVTDDVYKINVPAEYDMIIFSDKGNNKTLDLKIGGNNMIYDGSGWSVYADAPTEPTEASSETEPTEASSETEPSEASSETEPSEASSETEPTEA